MRRSILVFVLFTPFAIAAQLPKPVAVRPANATLRAEFSELTSVRELRDGRVLLTDWRDNRILVADWLTGAAVTISRVGDGPTEYRGTMPLVKLGGDSTLMADTYSRRWLIFDGARPTGTLRPDAPVVRTALLVWGVDRNGTVLTEWTPPRPGGNWSAGTEDSARMLLVPWTAGRTDTIGKLGAEAYVAGTAPGMAAYELALLAADGWVAALRINPYRVDWRTPEGRWILGRPIPGGSIPLDARERKAYLDRRAAAAAHPSTGGPAGRGKGIGGSSRPPPEITHWPATLPPYSIAQNGRPLMTEDGKIFVRRFPSADFPGPRYDVVNRRGELEARIAFPENQFILGFGAHSVYVVTSDDDGIQHLSRHPWP